MFDFGTLSTSGQTIRNDTAFQVISAAPFYVVITVTDIETGQTKEICTDYPGIEGAITKDNGNAFVDTKNRIITFRSKEALDNFDFLTSTH